MKNKKGMYVVIDEMAIVWNVRNRFYINTKNLETSNLKNCQLSVNSVTICKDMHCISNLSSGNIFSQREINKEVNYQQSSVLSSEQAAFLRLWSNFNVGKKYFDFFQKQGVILGFNSK